MKHTIQAYAFAFLGWAMLTAIVGLLAWAFLVGPVLMRVKGILP